MPRRFQFSLRALLVALTVACLWLGWKVERARRRGEAIDMVVKCGCAIDYLDDSGPSLHPEVLVGPHHFWHDLKGSPVCIRLNANAWSGDHLAPAISSPLSRIDGIRLIELIVRDGRRRVGDEKKRMAFLRRKFPGAYIEPLMIVY